MESQVPYVPQSVDLTTPHLLWDGSTAKKTAAQSGFEKYPSFYLAYAQIMGHEPLEDRGWTGSRKNYSRRFNAQLACKLSQK